ncbi:GrpB family protein [Salipaludibacillus sp. CUR1]|uniref:GrpB family protein n=1 Tax=Salipaludibacillus sp. CUR1 TaxID=2820003 RepID=UPI001E45AC64|nr:GrpB family protein [Salipaludibacillus sp. CUR1]
MRKTNIQAWSEEWNTLFLKETKVMKKIFKDEIEEIHHIGSTSVPAIGYAKPVIDILIGVKDLRKVDVYNEQMREAGYEPKGEYGIPGRRFFQKGNDNRSHHVHIFKKGNDQIDSHLAFRDYLSAHPEEAKKYGDLKVTLAKQFPHDHHKYQAGKKEFVSGLAEKANEWAVKK